VDWDPRQNHHELVQRDPSFAAPAQVSPLSKRGDLDATVVENRQRIQSVAWMKNDETKLKRWGTCPISFNQQVARWE